MTGLPVGYVFRRASNADGPMVRAHIFAILEEYGLTPDPEHADRGLENIDEAFAQGWLDLLISPDGELVGTVGFLPLTADMCELTKMFLSSAYRGKGLGKVLLNRVLGAARKAGFSVVELETDSALNEAVQLYRHYGFEQQDRCNSVLRCNMVMTLTL